MTGMRFGAASPSAPGVSRALRSTSPSALSGDPARAAEEAGAALDFEAVVGGHLPALVRRLVLVLGNQHDAEDVAQEAYLRAWESWGRFDGLDARAWLYTIGLRLAFNQLRSRRRRLAAIARLEPAPWRDSVDPDLAVALARLEPHARSAILLNVVDGYTQAEIAQMLGVPEGTVSSWISRGRATLRAALGDEAG